MRIRSNAELDPTQVAAQAVRRARLADPTPGVDPLAVDVPSLAAPRVASVRNGAPPAVRGARLANTSAQPTAL